MSAAGPPNPAVLQSSLAAAQQLMAALAPAAQACSALLANAAAAAAAQAEAKPAAATAEVAVQTERIDAAKQCGNCGAGREQLGRKQKLLRCPCKSVYYCSSQCQVGVHGRHLVAAAAGQAWLHVHRGNEIRGCLPCSW